MRFRQPQGQSGARTISPFAIPEGAVREPPNPDAHPPFVDFLSHADDRGRANRVHRPETCAKRWHGRQDCDGVFQAHWPFLDCRWGQRRLVHGGRGCRHCGPEPFFRRGLAGEDGSDSDDTRLSVAGTDVAEKLNEKWKDYGTVWMGVAESETLTFQIPQKPPTRNCITLVAR